MGEISNYILKNILYLMWIVSLMTDKKIYLS